MLNTREILHELVDKLPESELITAARILTALEQPLDRLEVLLAAAPDDDEPLAADDLDDTAGPFVSHADVIRDQGSD